MSKTRIKGNTMEERIVWLSSDKKTQYSDHYNLLIESGLYREEPVPPVVDLKDKEPCLSLISVTP